MEVWGEGRDSITLKARQIGWSTLIAGDTFWESFFQPDYDALLLSKGEREAVLLLSKAKYGYRHLPEWMRRRGPELMDNNVMRMTFDNDSQMLSLPSASDPARGYTGRRVVVDEMGQLPNSEQAWASIEPVADIGGQLILLGTANAKNRVYNATSKPSFGKGKERGKNEAFWKALFHQLVERER